MNKWRGFKDFSVYKKVEENAVISSFYLKPVEEEYKLTEYLSGQFISIRIPMEGGYSRTRQYTLSNLSNGEYYRISVKREESGNVSKILCDTVQEGDIVQISAPVGRFVLEDEESPVVLIGGGIGITPMLTMAYEAFNKKRSAQLIYSLTNSEMHIFEEEMELFNTEKSSVQLTTFYSRPTEEDKREKRFDIEGRISKEWLKEHVEINSKFYFCGPIEFMRTMYHYLVEIGVEKESIYYELFAPGEDITK